jgi:hypothetical protein
MSRSLGSRLLCHSASGSGEEQGHVVKCGPLWKQNRQHDLAMLWVAAYVGMAEIRLYEFPQLPQGSSCSCSILSEAEARAFNDTQIRPQPSIAPQITQYRHLCDAAPRELPIHFHVVSVTEPNGPPTAMAVLDSPSRCACHDRRYLGD